MITATSYSFSGVILSPLGSISIPARGNRKLGKSGPCVWPAWPAYNFLRIEIFCFASHPCRISALASKAVIGPIPDSPDKRRFQVGINVIGKWSYAGNSGNHNTGTAHEFSFGNFRLKYPWRAIKMEVNDRRKAGQFVRPSTLPAYCLLSI